MPFVTFYFGWFSSFGIFQAPMSIEYFLSLFVIGHFRFWCVLGRVHPHTLYAVSQTISKRAWVRRSTKKSFRFKSYAMPSIYHLVDLQCCITDSQSLLLQYRINPWTLDFLLLPPQIIRIEFKLLFCESTTKLHSYLWENMKMQHNHWDRVFNPKWNVLNNLWPHQRNELRMRNSSGNYIQQ